MSSRHLGPILVRDGNVEPLKRRHLGSAAESGEQREAFIQELIHRHPDVLPMAEIEPAFAGMRSVCTELRLKTGYLDNLWMTPNGGIVLGECKLFRNPQARREVIAQALDYAQSLQDLSYEEFEQLVATARRERDRFRLWPFLAPVDAEGEEESFFIDGVTRRLREGRFLVLVIGDGIHEGVEDLANYLQLHAGIHANLALVDLSLWELADGGMLVVPRLPLKTATIIRGVVQFAGSDTAIWVTPPELRPASAPARSGSRPTSGSEEEFFGQMEQRAPALVPTVRALLDALREAGVEARFTPQYVIFEVNGNEKRLYLWSIKFDGKMDWGWSTLLRDAGSTARKQMLETLVGEIARLTGTRLDFTPTGYFKLIRDGRDTRADIFTGHVEEVAAIAQDIVRLAAASAD